MFPNELMIEGIPRYHQARWSKLQPVVSTLADVEALFGKAAPKYVSDDVVYTYSVDDNTTPEIRYLGEVGFIRRGSYPKLQDARGVVRLDMYHRLYSVNLLFRHAVKLPVTFQPPRVFSVTCGQGASARLAISGRSLISSDGLVYTLTKRWKDLPASEFATRDKYPPSEIAVEGLTYTVSDATRLEYGLPLLAGNRR